MTYDCTMMICCNKSNCVVTFSRPLYFASIVDIETTNLFLLNRKIRLEPNLKHNQEWTCDLTIAIDGVELLVIGMSSTKKTINKRLNLGNHVKIRI